MKRILVLLLIAFAFNQLNLSATNTVSTDTSTNTISNDTIKPAQEAGLIVRIGNWYTENLNYYSVTALMTIESSFIPFPSEIVVPPATYAACTPGSSLYVTESEILNVIIVILFATLGALIGATINYILAFYLGRPIVYWFADSKLGRFFLLSSDKIKNAESYFVKHGKSSTLIGRLVPGIRQLISIPAGLAKMPFAPFILFTTIGATLWNTILAVLGYIAHGRKDLIDQYSNELSWGLLGLGIVFVLYLIYKGYKSRKKKNLQPETNE